MHSWAGLVLFFFIKNKEDLDRRNGGPEISRCLHAVISKVGFFVDRFGCFYKKRLMPGIISPEMFINNNGCLIVVTKYILVYKILYVYRDINL